MKRVSWRDQVRLVDAAYRLELGQREWLENLTDVYGTCVETRRTLISFVSQLRPNGSVVYLDLVSRDRRARWVAEASTAGDPSEYINIYVQDPEQHSLSTLFPPRLHAFVTQLLPEFVGLHCTTPLSIALVVGAEHDKAYVPSAGERTFWRPIARHLGAALRLRLTLGEPDAVLCPDGRLADASRAAASKPARERLRTAVLQRELVRSQRPSQQDALWPELVGGRWTLVDRFDSDGRRFVVAYRNDAGARAPHALSSQERELVQRAARGEANKSIAIELGISEATASRALDRALGKLRLNLAEALELSRTKTRSLRVGNEQLAYVELGEQLSNAAQTLSGSEREVAILALRGWTTAQIAASRQRATRTIINQLASAYAKLGVSSRRELAIRLLVDA